MQTPKVRVSDCWWPKPPHKTQTPTSGRVSDCRYDGRRRKLVVTQFRSKTRRACGTEQGGRRGGGGQVCQSTKLRRTAAAVTTLFCVRPEQHDTTLYFRTLRKLVIMPTPMCGCCCPSRVFGKPNQPALE
ncbi:hypothetical protein BaRGS_00015492 [Batillaria attramentaria]|uniref:Uncharacterized protein n=1 Tax=Batillaria attramentaria TaxID=370345 RepID=A0ABD0L206_9CAEN